MTIYSRCNENVKYLVFEWCVLFSVRFIFIFERCNFVIKKTKTCSSVFSVLIML